MTTSPTRRPGRTTRFVVGRVDEIPPGERRIVEAGGREIGVFNIGGRYYAMLNRCPHLGAPLCEGGVVNQIESSVPGDVRLDEGRTFVTCPFHNWEFDVETGRSAWNPALRARAFGVALEGAAEVRAALDQGEMGRIPGPYTVETVDVAVESDYVVLSLRPARGGTS
ncbi:rieske [2Fe-2S] domain protein [Pseudonocardia sp. Ae168_Ps1]|uniref:Rieske (2Fe-2S) protein n=1 Tax=unclassified Pseudonocardia TaxID=2619320 RepID=UPI00094B3147|nr:MULTISPECIES: Rieske (2Fe-2S) protein [unclassified Pseudonocardia]OLL72395.1 rieske [2Fe-2S] domain protein [Pseudonocardia sp. Ae150A_Ps1]OLL78367.1 rieske [2Fe-2S] domain protein [Pseudonocardia sp. Ae168_Ps1]OLL87507.1 rieske [2Fe-2S] domain protein [Pseudonocardia sp. Ae263_Ps1]OLL92464.1 rieske [2Fe-2S] domain protein [Pseudonocardia sp. Ae356_Ps1]